MFKVGPTYDQELRAYGSKRNTNSDKSLGVNKVIRKHHALQTDRRGKPILPNGQKGRTQGPRSAKGFVQQGKKRQGKDPYQPIEEIRDPMEGKPVADPSQLLETTIEVLR